MLGEQEFADKLHSSVAYRIIYFFNDISHTNMSTIYLQVCFIFRRGAFSANAP